MKTKVRLSEGFAIKDISLKNERNPMNYIRSKLTIGEIIDFVISAAMVTVTIDLWKPKSGTVRGPFHNERSLKK